MEVIPWFKALRAMEPVIQAQENRPLGSFNAVSTRMVSRQRKAQFVIKKAKKQKLLKAVKKLEDNIHETLAYYDFTSDENLSIPLADW